jgi:transposase-like protein
MKKRHSLEQIVLKLRQVDEKLASGASIPEVARDLGVSEATYHRWRNRYGEMNLSETKRLKEELEKENTRLKKLVADQAPDIQILKEASRKKFRAQPGDGRRSSTCEAS